MLQLGLLTFVLIKDVKKEIVDIKATVGNVERAVVTTVSEQLVSQLQIKTYVMNEKAGCFDLLFFSSSIEAEIIGL